ncbi:Uncharacterised protein [uncultured archaeon]|nr:Uncharacterised protein [uncultured archaeon]
MDKIKNKSSLKRKAEKGMSIFEIFILVVSIAAFAYLLGNEFKIVSATASSIDINDVTDSQLIWEAGKSGYSLQLSVNYGTKYKPSLAYYEWKIMTPENFQLIIPGLSFNTETGILSGTPTTAGTYTFKVQTQISEGNNPLYVSNPKTFALTIINPEASTTSSTSFAINSASPSVTVGQKDTLFTLTTNIKSIYSLSGCEVHWEVSNAASTIGSAGHNIDYNQFSGEFYSLGGVKNAGSTSFSVTAKAYCSAGGGSQKIKGTDTKSFTLTINPRTATTGTGTNNNEEANKKCNSGASCVDKNKCVDLNAKYGTTRTSCNVRTGFIELNGNGVCCDKLDLIGEKETSKEPSSTPSAVDMASLAGGYLDVYGKAKTAVTDLTSQQQGNTNPNSASPGTGYKGYTQDEAPNFLSNIFNNGGIWAIVGNSVIAVGLWAGLWGISTIPGNPDPQAWSDAGIVLGIGYAAGSAIETLLFGLGVIGKDTTFLFTGFVGGLIGLGISAILFVIFHREREVVAVQYTCNSWQPATGGANCEKCNTGQLPCTKYKCESLGQNCELLNEGTSEEKCYFNNRNDVTPPTMSAWEGALQEGFKYEPATTSASDKGVKIINTETSDGCALPFQKITYGINLDKPGQCRIDTVRKSTFDSMTNPGLISQGHFIENHSILSFHPGTSELSDEGVQIENGGNYETYVRCQSKNGVSTAGTFVFKYCVQSQPDTTAPSVELTNPSNGAPTQKGVTSKSVDVYTDKPSDCKWSHNDESYDAMTNTMTCAQESTEISANMLYKCTTTLTGIRDEVENNFYFRCKSYPSKQGTDKESERTAMTQSYVYKLIGTRDLVINSIAPLDGTTIKDSTQSVHVKLEAVTSAGYQNGEAACFFKESSETIYAKFANTDSYQHSQDLWLDSGTYTYSIKCCDSGLNCQTQATTFTVKTDTTAPIVTRVYNDVNQLKITTNEKADCVYDTTNCGYDFKDGLKMTTADNLAHSTDWNINSIFYIKCKDEFGNQPSPAECSLIARPVSSY